MATKLWFPAVFMLLTACASDTALQDPSVSDKGSPDYIFLTSNPLCLIFCTSSKAITGGDLAAGEGQFTGGTKSVSSTQSNQRGN